MGLINWQEAEKYTSWAMSRNEIPTGWDRGAEGWQKRIDFEKEFTAAQVTACSRITKNTTVLDACCGTGRTALPFARKAKHVYAVDAGEQMLSYCQDNAKAAGLENITVKRIDNWHTLKPGTVVPLVDVAVSVIGPPQADVLNFSRFATQYCYFLSFTGAPYRAVMAELFEGTHDPVWGSLSERGQQMRRTMSQDPVAQALLGKRKNTCNLDIPFNILYDHGALPEVTYASGAWAHEADTREAIYNYLRTLGQVTESEEEVFRTNCDKRITKTEQGHFRYAYKSQMYVLGWDPRELE